MPTPYYDKGGITIYHGDALEILPSLPPVASVITDPPYGINTKSDGNGKLSPWADYVNSAHWYKLWLGECRRLLKAEGSLWSCLNWRSLVTFQKAACDLDWPIESLMVWDKKWIGPGGSRGLRPSYEQVALWAMPQFAIKCRGLYDIQAFPWSSQKLYDHPAEKPVELAAFCVRHGTIVSGPVLDPFMGSGTTLRAAKNEGLEAIGIEQDERWCEVAARRLEQEVFAWGEAE